MVKEEYTAASPFKFLTRFGEGFDNKPFDSPFKEFCAKLSPIQDRGQTPLSFKKSSVNKNPEYDAIFF